MTGRAAPSQIQLVPQCNICPAAAALTAREIQMKTQFRACKREEENKATVNGKIFIPCSCLTEKYCMGYFEEI